MLNMLLDKVNNNKKNRHKSFQCFTVTDIPPKRQCWDATHCLSNCLSMALKIHASKQNQMLQLENYRPIESDQPLALKFCFPPPEMSKNHRISTWKTKVRYTNQIEKYIINHSNTNINTNIILPQQLTSPLLQSTPWCRHGLWVSSWRCTINCN